MPNLETENEVIKKCESFNYLGFIICAEDTCDKNIETRIIMGKRATAVLYGFIWIHNITQETKKIIFRSIVEIILLYGAEM
jgi:hypothetical protein